MKVLIAGGSGLIGQALTDFLLEKNIEVVWLVRNRTTYKNVSVFLWNPKNKTVDASAFDNTDAIINLAGAGIADKPWTAARKKEITESRTEAAATLFKFLSEQKHNVKTVINAAAIGIYGKLNGKYLTEDLIYNGDDFLSESCIAWESAAHQFEQLNMRTVILRIGIVLTTKGGALKEMLMPFKFKTAATFTEGQMQTSWIHISDLCSIFEFALRNKISGVFNATAPQPVSNKELIAAISKIEKPLLKIAVPLFILKLMLGERTEMILQSVHASSAKIESAGFRFQFDNINQAIENILKHKL